MGKSYSLGGYLNAVTKRSARTLLVEGPSDKSAVHRVAAEQIPKLAHEFSVDHAALIDDTDLAGLGAKAKVLRVRVAADALLHQHPKLSNLACLTDREWDGIVLDAAALNGGWAPPVQLANHFITIGHSIENYHFDCECVLRYLKFAFAEHVNHAVLESVTGGFRSAVALAGAVSFEVQAASCITRFGGLVNLEQVELRNARLYLGPPFVDAARARELPDPDLFMQKVNEAVDTQWTTLAAAPHARWLLHGHIGSDVLWACVGLLALRAGVPAPIAQQISRGCQNERRRFWFDWLATEGGERRVPLDNATMWLQSGVAEPAEIAAIVSSEVK